MPGGIPAPVITPTGEIISPKQRVRIRCDYKGIDIFYTTTGDKPVPFTKNTTTNAQTTRYTKPFRLGAGRRVVKAIAVSRTSLRAAPSAITTKYFEVSEDAPDQRKGGAGSGNEDDDALSRSATPEFEPDATMEHFLSSDEDDDAALASRSLYRSAARARSRSRSPRSRTQHGRHRPTRSPRTRRRQRSKRQRSGTTGVEDLDLGLGLGPGSGTGSGSASGSELSEVEELIETSRRRAQHRHRPALGRRAATNPGSLEKGSLRATQRRPLQETLRLSTADPRHDGSRMTTLRRDPRATVNPDPAPFRPHSSGPVTNGAAAAGVTFANGGAGAVDQPVMMAEDGAALVSARRMLERADFLLGGQHQGAPGYTTMSEPAYPTSSPAPPSLQQQQQQQQQQQGYAHQQPQQVQGWQHPPLSQQPYPQQQAQQHYQHQHQHQQQQFFQQPQQPQPTPWQSQQSQQQQQQQGPGMNNSATQQWPYAAPQPQLTAQQQQQQQHQPTPPWESKGTDAFAVGVDGGDDAEKPTLADMIKDVRVNADPEVTLKEILAVPQYKHYLKGMLLQDIEKDSKAHHRFGNQKSIGIQTTALNFGTTLEGSTQAGGRDAKAAGDIGSTAGSNAGVTTGGHKVRDVSPGKGFWRMQIEHIAHHLKSYCRDQPSFQAALGQPRMCNVTSASLDDDGESVIISVTLRKHKPAAAPLLGARGKRVAARSLHPQAKRREDGEDGDDWLSGDDEDNEEAWGEESSWTDEEDATSTSRRRAKSRQDKRRQREQEGMRSGKLKATARLKPAKPGSTLKLSKEDEDIFGSALDDIELRHGKSFRASSRAKSTNAVSPAGRHSRNSARRRGRTRGDGDDEVDEDEDKDDDWLEGEHEGEEEKGEREMRGGRRKRDTCSGERQRSKGSRYHRRRDASGAGDEDDGNGNGDPDKRHGRSRSRTLQRHAALSPSQRTRSKLRSTRETSAGSRSGGGSGRDSERTRSARGLRGGREASAGAIDPRERERETAERQAKADELAKRRKARIDKKIGERKEGMSATTKQLFQEVGNTGEGREDTVMELLDQGADVKAKSLMHTSPLYEAVRNGHLECAKALIDAEAPVNATNTKGNTALHGAVLAPRNNEELINLLLASGASLTLKNRDGQTPYAMAVQMGRKGLAAKISTSLGDKLLEELTGDTAA